MFKCTDTASSAHTDVPGTEVIELKTITPEGTASAAVNETGELAKRPVAGLQKLQAPSDLMNTFRHISDSVFFHPEDKTAEDQLNQFIQNVAAVEEQVFVHGKSELYGTHDEQLQQLAEWLNDPDVDLELKKLAISQLPEAADSVDFLLCGFQCSLAILKCQNLQMAKRLIKTREAEQEEAAVYFEKIISAAALQHAQAQKIDDAVAAQELLKQKELHIQSRVGSPFSLICQYVKELTSPENNAVQLDALKQAIGYERYSRLEQAARTKCRCQLDSLNSKHLFKLIMYTPEIIWPTARELYQIPEQWLPTTDDTPCRLTEDYAVVVGCAGRRQPADLNILMNIDFSRIHPHLKNVILLSVSLHWKLNSKAAKAEAMQFFLDMKLDEPYFAPSEDYKYFLKDLAKEVIDSMLDNSIQLQWAANASLEDIKRAEPLLKSKRDISACGKRLRELQVSVGKPDHDYSGMDVQQLPQLSRLERRNCFLHFIRTNRRDKIIQLLTACGADGIFCDVWAFDVIEAVSKTDKTGRLTLLTFLESQGYQSVSEDDADSLSGMIYACYISDEKIASHLLEKYHTQGKQDQLSCVFNRRGRGLMHLAVSSDHKDKRNSERKLAVVEKLYSVYPNIMTMKRRQPVKGSEWCARFAGDRPLHSYVRDAASGKTAMDTKILEFVWDKSESVRFEQVLLSKSEEKGDALMIAAESGNFPLVDALLEIYSKMPSQKALDSIKTARALMQQRGETKEEEEIIQRLINAEAPYRVRDHSGTDSRKSCVIS